jgi:RimJ/RimL family protein N-acetyltransferase
MPKRQTPPQLEDAVPARLPRLRPALPRDLAAIARWIVLGRREGAFRGQPALTPAELRRYQRTQGTDGWGYSCIVIEDGATPIGYADYRLRGARGEMLGMYIERRARQRRYARHIARWMAADLRERGCRDVTTHVYADNGPSQRALAAAGFSARRSRRERGRRLVIMGRKLSPLPRLGRTEPLYARLSGETHYLHHVALAEALAEGMRRRARPDLILGLGSLARGFADAWSDLDIAVVGPARGIARLWRGERWFAGVSLDLHGVDPAAAPAHTWDDGRREALQESVVLWSRTPGAGAALARAVRLREPERKRRMRELVFKIGWSGFEPLGWFDRPRHGYRWALPHDLWMRRGCADSAHATIDRVLDHLLELLFLMNKRHAPDPKWRRYLATGLAWLPAHFEQRLAVIERGPRGKVGFARRASAMLAAVEATTDRLIAEGILDADIYTPYLRTSGEYGPEI